MDNFTAIRNGLLQHINEGKLCPFDLGIYVYLHLRADWSTGIFHGCALSIAHGFNDPSLKHHINKSLGRLRERQYINYRKGDGRRGGYEVLIHKYQVTVGELSGHRLNAWKQGSLCQPEYERCNGDVTVEGEWRKSGGTLSRLTRRATPEDDQNATAKASLRSRASFTPPSLEEVSLYCQEHGYLIDPPQWIDYYASNGWKVGRNPMTDWRASVRTWARNAGGLKGNQKNGKQTLSEIVAREKAILRSRAG